MNNEIDINSNFPASAFILEWWGVYIYGTLARIPSFSPGPPERWVRGGVTMLRTVQNNDYE